MRPAAKGKGVRPAGNLFDRPAAADLIGLAAGERPRFWVTIDTEEDFDWSAPFARTGYRLDSVPALADCQTWFDRAGVRPIYLVDWPVVADDRAVGILGAAQAAGRCAIGAQLHPWVTPPREDRKRGAEGKRGAGRVNLGGRRTRNKKKK